MKILNEAQIKQKIKRLAYEILENNYDEDELIILGINNNGLYFAKLLKAALQRISQIPLKVIPLKLSPAAPLDHPIEIGAPVETLNGKVLLVVDDVANTGRTIYYAFRPLMDILPKKVEVAVLVDRKHKSFPVKVDYVGLSLATTFMEDIDVRLREVEEMEVFLN